MSTASPPIQKLTQRLVAFEATRPKAADACPEESIRVCVKLRGHLSTLMGTAGFEALLSRAVSLAKAEVPSLAEALVSSNGSCEGFDVLLQNQDAATAKKTGIILVAHLLDLLVTFLGESLTLHLMQDAWPDASADIMNLDAGDKS